MNRVLVVACVLLVTAALLPPTATAQQPECDGNFHLVHTVGDGHLSDLDLSSQMDGWAVGFDYESEESSKERPLVVHFDRDSFERITPPTSGKVAMTLSGVEAFSPDDVHVVGYTNAFAAKPVALHWDGSTWNRLETPTPGVRSFLFEISGSSPNDIWAVGFWLRRSGEEETLVLHYDGTGWSRVDAPSPGTRYSWLLDVDVSSPNDAWAIGNKGKHVLILRFDGETWQRIRADELFQRNDIFWAIDAVTPEDVWAAGNRRKVVHFDGSTFVPTAFPDQRGTSETFYDIAATPTEGWVVGFKFVLAPYEGFVPLAGLFNDGAWQAVGHEGDAYGSFEGVTVDDTGAAWAVGELFDPEGPDLGEVIERACI